MPPLSWRHHTLIQALLSRGPLKAEDFHSIFSELTGKSPGTHQQIFNDHLLKINKELSYVQLELRACRNQYNGDVYYGVVNNVSDEQSKLGTRYTIPQIAFYKSIIEAVVQEPDAMGSISSINALVINMENQVPTATSSQSLEGSSRIPPTFKNFTMSQKEKTLEELVQDHWLCSTVDGRIGLGVRSFLDLRSWFNSNEIPPCEVCNEAGVKAELCPNDGCNVRIHQYCLKKKFSQRKAEKVCPVCHTRWPYSMPKVEVLEADDDSNGPHTQPPSNSSTGKRSRNCEKGGTQIPSSALDDDSNGPSQVQQPPKPPTRKRARNFENGGAETSGSAFSHAPASSQSALTLDTRRTTRSSARLRGSN